MVKSGRAPRKRSSLQVWPDAPPSTQGHRVLVLRPESGQEHRAWVLRPESGQEHRAWVLRLASGQGHRVLVLRQESGQEHRVLVLRLASGQGRRVLVLRRRTEADPSTGSGSAERRGAPHYSVRLSDWNTKPQIKRDQFTF
jgi:hypothetical protein